MRSSPDYVGTVDHDEEGLKKIALVRDVLRRVNYDRKLKGDPTRFRLHPRGRLGKGNPHAVHYQRGGCYWRWSSITIKPEHSTRFDLYIRTVKVRN